MLGFKDSGAQQRFRIQPSNCSGSNCFSRSELRVERFRSSYRGYIVMQLAQADVLEDIIARMTGVNAAEPLGVRLLEPAGE
jgi:hypothetical protein